jgi:Fe-S-cluster-containing dehydrogenase component
MRKIIFRDKDKCIACFACVVACKIKHHTSPFPVSPPEAEPKGVKRVNVYQIGPFVEAEKVVQFFQPLSCMHCVDAPCISVCPFSAIYKDREFGITLVRKEKCIGCRACLWVCPFGAPSFDENGKMVLCDMCIDRLKEGRKTACEATCPAGAIKTGIDQEIIDLQAKKAIERIKGSASAAQSVCQGNLNRDFKEELEKA